MSQKQALLDAENAAWHELHARFDRVPVDAWEKPGVNGDWSAKDVMAHVAAWHANTADRFESLRTTGKLPDAPDVDAFNEQVYRECLDVSLHDIRAHSEASRHQFREEIGSTTEPLGDRIAQIIAANGHGHYEEHIPQLDASLESR